MLELEKSELREELVNDAETEVDVEDASKEDDRAEDAELDIL